MPLELETDSQRRDERQTHLRARADAWLVRLRPLEGDTARLTRDDVTASLALIEQLEADAPEILTELREVADPSADAARTLALADGLAFLAAARADLHERLELLGSTPQTQRKALELVLSRPNRHEMTQAGFFAAFWNGFTLLHGSIMIGAFWKGIGPAALFLLLFYGLFFAVGVGLIRSALEARCQESIRLDDGLLTVTKTGSGQARTQEIVLGPESRVKIVRQNTQVKGRPTRYDLSIRDASGKEQRFGSRIPDHERDNVCKRLSEAISREIGVHSHL